ncbi:MAG: polysaccharide biosynthesis tyrosine autokinase [Paludibacteraceae bacterium]|nr:polysaccharide biosynthesis tyrosine autokinase [Paludibacteraceae bacterium]MCR5570089.1 polysaccharide biosynthesis tyrosine autokinase [Paludibacteraceae bacterium]
MFEENNQYMSAIQHSENEEDSLEWKNIVDIIVNNKLWIVLSIVCFLFLALVYLRHTPKMYSSTTSFIVKDEKKGGAMGGISSEFSDLGLLSTKSSVDDEIEAFKSPYLMYMVVKQLKLDVSYTKKQFLKSTDLYTLTPVTATFPQLRDEDIFSFKVRFVSVNNFEISDFRKYDSEIGDYVEFENVVNARPFQNVKTPIGDVSLAPSAEFSTDCVGGEVVISKNDAYKLAKNLSQNLNVELVSKKSSVVNIAYKDFSPKKATDVLNNLLDIYNRERIEDNRQMAANTSKFIDGRLLIIEQELGGIDNDIERYKSTELLTNVQAAGTSYLGESNAYSAKSLEANNQLSIAQFIKNCIKAPTDKPTMLPANAGLADEGISKQITEYNSMVMKYNRLMANSSEKNPLVIELKNQMNSLSASIDNTLDNLIQAYTMKVESLKGKENQIHQKIAANPRQEKYLLSIGRQQKIKESLYLYLLQKREENELSGNLMVSNLRILTPPRGEDKPVSPKKLQILIVALVLGFVFPVGLFWLLDVLDGTVRGKKDLACLSLPYLGDIPLCGRIKDNSKLPLPVRIVVADKKRDAANESFRVLRSNLNFMIANKDSHVMMYTSFFPNSGKTFVAANLAVGIALTGKKVILIDADMRKAELSKHMANKRQGLSTYLNGQSSDLKHLIVKSSEHENLSILPCGAMPPNPSELLLTDKLEKLINELKGMYDYIFIDCTPLNIVADASIVGKYADLVLFVIRQGKFIRQALPELEAFYKNGTFKSMATILNGTFDAHSYGRYGNYGTYGSYGSYGSYGTYGYYGSTSDEAEED